MVSQGKRDAAGPVGVSAHGAEYFTADAQLDGVRGTVVGDNGYLPREAFSAQRFNNAESHAVVGGENTFDIIPEAGEHR